MEITLIQNGKVIPNNRDNITLLKDDRPIFIVRGMRRRMCGQTLITMVTGLLTSKSVFEAETFMSMFSDDQIAEIFQEMTEQRIRDGKPVLL